MYLYYFSETVGVVLHKDSKWYQSWQNFRDNNQYVNSKYSQTCLKQAVKG